MGKSMVKWAVAGCCILMATGIAAGCGTSVSVTSYSNDEFNNVLLGKKDVNTALRDFEESVNKAIAAEKAK